MIIIVGFRLAYSVGLESCSENCTAGSDRLAKDVASRCMVLICLFFLFASAQRGSRRGSHGCVCEGSGTLAPGVAPSRFVG